MNHMSHFRFVFVMLIMLFSVSCNGSNDGNSENNEVAEIVEGNDPYNYIASVAGQEISISGSEFQVRTDNCGASVSAIETLSRSRSFDIRLEANIATSLGGEFEGDILVAGAKAQAAIETSLGISIGTTETVNAERELETPADTIYIVTLQWEELWTTGNVNIVDSTGKLEAEIPFRVLTTLRLSQKAVAEIPCSTTTAAVNENIQSPPTEAPIVPSTVTPIPPSHTPIPPTATNTPPPLPTSTSIPTGTATNTPPPLPTSTSIPTGPRAIGQEFSDGNVSLTLTDYEIDSSTIRFEFVVKNVSNIDTLMRYQNSYFTLSDSTGNEYEYRVLALYDTKQRLMTPNEAVELSSDYAVSHVFDSLGFYSGVVSENAEFLLVKVSQFMGLENMQWRIDLGPASTSGQNPAASTSLLIGQEFSNGNVSLTLTDYEIAPSTIRFEFVVKNVSNSNTLMRYQNNYFTLSDSTGKEYEYMVRGLYDTQQRLLTPNEAVELRSDYANSHDFARLGYYSGTISENAEFLLVKVSQFMGLENMQWRIDL